MSAPVTVHADNLIAPSDGKIHVFSASLTAGVVTLTDTDELGKSAFNEGPYLTLRVDEGSLYFFVSSSATPSTAPAAGVAGAAWRMDDGEEKHYRLQRDGGGLKTKLHYAASAAGTIVRAYISSALTSNDDGNPTQ